MEIRASTGAYVLDAGPDDKREETLAHLPCARTTTASVARNTKIEKAHSVYELYTPQHALAPQTQHPRIPIYDLNEKAHKNKSDVADAPFDGVVHGEFPRYAVPRGEETE